MSRIERHVGMHFSGTMAGEARSVPIPDLLPEIRRSYRCLARQRGLEFTVDIAADVLGGYLARSESASAGSTISICLPQSALDP